MSANETGRLLDVLLAGDPVGTLERRAPDRYRFQYAPRTVDQRGAGAIVLSASLPIRTEPFTPSETKPFFEGLLPEGAIRETIAKNLRLSVDNGFGLLEALGAECAGAVALIGRAEGDHAESPGAGMRWLDEEALAELVRELPEHPLGVSDGEQVRLSLGGVQEKLLLTRTPAGRYGQPLRGGPSTHILKPGQERYPGVVANEAFCLRVANCVGLPVAKTEIVEIAKRRCLLVERFDRTYDEQGKIACLHQEDICQALGRLPSAKYEVEGGPSLADTFELLRDLAGASTARDINNLLLATVLNWLLGNSDAHGKNYGLVYDGTEEIRLAPIYDVVSTNVYDLKPEMAMLIGGVEDPARVSRESWRKMGSECGLGGQLLDQIENLLAKALKCAKAIRETAMAEDWHEPVIDEIVALAERRAAQL
ncbi:MAG TPA: type II toxin-antitoxin system HipA family toxin [Solirubrobacteraceae bacterium]|jgi:serine/threonine-protein kinase HipA